MPQCYLTFDGAGAYSGRGVSFDPPGDDGTVPLPAGSVACTQDQYAGAGAWTALRAGAIVLGEPPALVTPIAYLPAWLVRQRLAAANLWADAVGAMSADQQLEFATLQEGIDPADGSVVALLTAIGADPEVILAPM